MIYGKLAPGGILTDGQYTGGQERIWPDGSTDVLLAAMPDPGLQQPYGYDPVNQLAITFVPPLAQAQAQITAGLFQQANNLMSAAYPPATLTYLNLLLTQATAAGQSGRAAYIGQVVEWGSQVISAYETEAAQVTALTDATVVMAYVWDTSFLALGNPLVTIPGALAIMN